jgi:uncharacterized protein YbjQ (UPF0145 family)
MEFVLFLLITISLLGVGFLVGGRNERKHIADIEVREQRYRELLVTDLKTPLGFSEVTNGTLVFGQAVIGSDYLKTWLGNWRNLFGGEMKSFQTLMSRSRREARLRMVESAVNQGAAGVINVRFETSQIKVKTLRGKRSGLPISEMLCYGTAVFRN